jgi:hypothetical protein
MSYPDQIFLEMLEIDTSYIPANYWLKAKFSTLKNNTEKNGHRRFRRTYGLTDPDTGDPKKYR